MPVAGHVHAADVAVMRGATLPRAAHLVRVRVRVMVWAMVWVRVRVRKG